MSKRSDIIQATKSLLWDLGYESMSPKKVLAQSGAGQGSLYHFFSGKEDLAYTALEEISTELITVTKTIFGPEKPPMQRLYEYLFMDRQALKGCRLGRLSQEKNIQNSRLREPIANYFQTLRECLKTAIEEAQQEQLLSNEIPAEGFAKLLQATIQGAFTLSKSENDQQLMKDIQKTAWQMLEHFSTQ